MKNKPTTQKKLTSNVYKSKTPPLVVQHPGQDTRPIPQWVLAFLKTPHLNLGRRF